MICTRVSALPQAQRAGRKASVYKVSLNKEVPHSPSPMAPKKPSPAIKKGAKVLVVGAGRIGCELLKTLALSGCQDIHIIDMGLMKVGDLNGQFLFRQLDVGKSKASVARCVVLKFWPHISITPYHACVEHPHFGAGFFAQFDVVLNALDNFEAKRHVNRQCLAYDVPLIESWTAGFLGQVTVHVKRQTKCYECQPKSAPEMHHVCSTTSTSSEVLRHGLFESNEIVGNIGPAVEATNAIIAGLIVIETVKVLQNDTKNYRMTYCSVHPTKKMLLMPVKPFEPNKSCYVCSETPLSLEINTKRAKLRDIVEKIVKNKLGMNSPIIRHGAAALYKFGGCRDTPKMRINYDVNLDKVLSELPSPVTSGTMLTIVDLQQDLSCIFNFKHREEFDEEKEPDGMVLSGLIQATSVLMDDKKSNDDSGSTSSASELEADEDSEIECAPGKKRKRSEVSGADMSSVAGDTTSHGKLEIGDEISNGKRSRSEDPAREPHHLRTLPDDCAAAPSLSNKGFKSIKPKPSLVVGGEGCRICGHDHHHTVHCPFLDYLPPGTTVGPDYLVICCICGSELPQPAPKWCVHCCEQGGRAVEASTIKFFDEDWRHHHPERFWGPDESEDVCI